jgi:hypothetical protein
MVRARLTLSPLPRRHSLASRGMHSRATTTAGCARRGVRCCALLAFRCALRVARCAPVQGEIQRIRMQEEQARLDEVPLAMVTGMAGSARKRKKKSKRAGSGKQAASAADGAGDGGNPQETSPGLDEDAAMDEGESIVGGVIEDSDIFKQFCLNYMTERAREDATLVHARRVRLAGWIEEETGRPGRAGQAAVWKAQWELRAERVAGGPSAADLPHLGRDIICRVVTTLSMGHEMYVGFDRLLQRIMRLLGDAQPTFRSRALKAVSAVVEVDPVLMGEGSLQKAVRGRFLDEAISVRQVRARHPSPVTRSPVHPSPVALPPSPFPRAPSPFTRHPSPFTRHPHPSPFSSSRPTPHTSSHLSSPPCDKPALHTTTQHTNHPTFLRRPRVWVWRRPPWISSGGTSSTSPI